MIADRAAGFSVIEMLVVAAILAAVAMVLAGAMLRPSSGDESGTDPLFKLLLEAKSAVVLAGVPGVVVFEAGKATFREKTVGWSGDLRVGSVASADYRLVINPDGTFSGDRPVLLLNGSSIPAPGVYRSESRP